jgi:superoxide dismutase, Cu-Zn family
MINKIIKMLLVTFSLLIAQQALAEVVVKMHSTTAKKKVVGRFIGTIVATDTSYGLLLIPHLKGLRPGVHGFHVHQNPFCQKLGMAAGGHLDPNNTNTHQGPYSDKGHFGDLPALTVDREGRATLPVLAPRLKEADLKGHALMIHSGSDNYSDSPAMGGGGKRIACGVIR